MMPPVDAEMMKALRDKINKTFDQITNHNGQRPGEKMTTIKTTTVQHSPCRVTPAQIDALIAASTWTDAKMGEKTTVVCCKLPNGFEVIESSGCVDPANYDHGMGIGICRKRIVDQIWKLEGYALADRWHRAGPLNPVALGSG
jgi:hypothetical protein